MRPVPSGSPRLALDFRSGQEAEPRGYCLFNFTIHYFRMTREPLLNSVVSSKCVSRISNMAGIPGDYKVDSRETDKGNLSALESALPACLGKFTDVTRGSPRGARKIGRTGGARLESALVIVESALAPCWRRQPSHRVGTEITLLNLRFCYRTQNLSCPPTEL